MKSALFWIKQLGLKPHPEGGYYREMYRSLEMVPANALSERYASSRCFSTTIYFLLENQEYSKFHRLKTDEIWHFYSGSAITIHVITPEGGYHSFQLGPDFEKGEQFQAIIPAGHWFGATVNPGGAFTLAGCSVSPGFEFEDFELGDRSKLLAQYPQHSTLIEALT
jgi:predicted cupin superfamily sugar epimerase